jgi:hypothetical protein
MVFEMEIREGERGLLPHVLRPTVLSTMKDNRATALSAEVKLGARGVPALGV